MQTENGHLEKISEAEARRRIAAGHGGRIIGTGEEVEVEARTGSRDRFVIESIGERFVVVRAKAGFSFTAQVDEEITIRDCAFAVRRIFGRGRKMLLEGVPPSPSEDERGTP